MGPRQYWAFATPRYTGAVKTVLRFRLDRDKDKPLYSNEFDGSINPEQFTVKEGHAPAGVMDPYDE